MKLRLAVSVLACCLLGACAQGAAAPSDGPATPPSPSASVGAAATVAPASPAAPAPAPATSPAPAPSATEKGLTGIQDLPDPVAAVAEAAVGVQGTPVAAARWSDANGENLAVLARTVGEGAAQGGGRTTSASLYGYHFAGREGDLALVRDVRDFVTDCPNDTVARFVARTVREYPPGQDDLQPFFNPWEDDPARAETVHGPLEVTDVDGDGVGELTFAYSVACLSDVSPATLKLLVLEDGDKYILRGGTLPAQVEGVPVRDAEPEPARDRWPAPLWQHATDRYDRYVVR